MKTKYFKIDKYGLFLFKYRITTSKLETLGEIHQYKKISLPLGINIYYL